MVDSLERLARDFDDAGDDLGRHADRLVRSSTLRTEALGKANAPVLTGYLKSSISSDFEGGSGSGSIVGETGPDTKYDIYVHNGTSKQRPNPFMDRAAAVVEPQFFAAGEAIPAKLRISRGH